MDNRLETIKRLFSPKAQEHKVGRAKKQVRLVRPHKQVEKPKREYRRKVITTHHFTEEEIKQLEEERKLEEELHYWFYYYLEKYKAKRG